MATIVLVHGIAQEQEAADTLESEWVPALAGGVRTAGYPNIADRIQRDRATKDTIDARMAFYGALYRKSDQQGDDPGEFSAEESAIAQALAVDWLARAATQASRPDERATAFRELA
jgi:hypothetical protein